MMSQTASPRHDAEAPSAQPSGQPAAPALRTFISHITWLRPIIDAYDARPWVPVVLIALIGFLGGLLCISAISPTSRVGGTGNWWPMVLTMADGQGFRSCQPQYFPFCRTADQTSASREPLPILVFGGLAVITGRSLYAAALLEIALFLGVMYATYKLARHRFKRKVSLLSALLWVLYIPAYRLIPQVSSDLIAAIGLIGALYWIVRARQEHRTAHWAIAGLFLAVGALSRSVILFIAVTLILYHIPVRSLILTRRIKLIVPAAAMAGALALTISPWVVRNSIELGSPITGTTLNGYNLYRHNHQIAQDDYLFYTSPTRAREAVQQLLDRRADLRGDEGEVAMDRVYRDEALRIIVEHPDRYIALSLYRILPLWFDYGISQAYEDESTLLDTLITIQQVMLVALGAIGFWRLGRRGHLLLLPIVVLTLLHMAVVGRMRYTVIVMPLVLIAAAVALSDGIVHLASRRATIPHGADRRIV